MRHVLLVLSVAALALSVGACKNSTTKADPTSTVKGQLSTSSFLVAPTGVDAIDELGARTQASIAGDGGFRLDLVKDHVYTLVVRGPNGDEPVVFPRKGGRLDRTFIVSSGASVADLGLVRHLDRAPASGFVQSARASSAKPATSGDGEVGECVDGKIQGTGAVCVDDDEKATCEGASEASDGECENGKDAKTGQVCSDPVEVGNHDAQDADADQPMAVPEKNPPRRRGRLQ